MKKRKIMLLRFGIVLVILTLLLSGLIGCTKKKVYKGKEGTVTVEEKGDSGKVTVKTKEGEAEIETGSKKLPKDWPADMPIYKEAKITSSSSIKGEGGSASLSVALETSDGVESVKDFYQKNLVDKKWEVTQMAATSQDGEEGAMLSTSKGDLTGIITIQGSPGEKTEIVVQVFTNK